MDCFCSVSTQDAANDSVQLRHIQTEHISELVMGDNSSSMLSLPPQPKRRRRQLSTVTVPVAVVMDQDAMPLPNSLIIMILLYLGPYEWILLDNDKLQSPQLLNILRG